MVKDDFVPAREAAIGGGLGLAVSADFRVTCPEARFAANFTKLGFHPGFGTTAALPRLIGEQRAALDRAVVAGRIAGDDVAGPVNSLDFRSQFGENL